MTQFVLFNFIQTEKRLHFHADLPENAEAALTLILADVSRPFSNPALILC